jgi:CNT family concentrative nucleoside transporter
MERAMAHFQGVIGLGLILALAALLSEARRSLPSWRWIAGALALQFLIALAIVRIPSVWSAIGLANGLVTAVETATRAGSSYMFGYLGGATLPFDLADGAARPVIVAFDILPLVIVLSALSALLWRWGVLRLLVRLLSFLLRRTLGVSGVVGLSGGANLFLGVVEAPLVVRAYFDRMSRSELFCVMTLSMATVSGAVMVLYAQTLANVVDNPIGHMISASLISLPAAILIARMMSPGDGHTSADLSDPALAYEGSMDAIVRGTMEGVQLFIAVIGVIIVMFALVNLADQALALIPVGGEEPLTLRGVFGQLFAPLMWTLGVPWEDAQAAGALMGTKAILNEYVAYLDMAALSPEALGERSRLITAYALCGFANLASIGLLISVIGSLSPGRRGEAAKLGFRSWIAGNLATAMTGAVIGLVTF